MKESTISVGILGAGSRGWNFARLLQGMGHLAQLTAVAEPRKESRESFAKEFGISPKNVFKSWADFLSGPRRCDAVILATMDRDHIEPAKVLFEKGYHVLLEKPLAPNLEDCRAIAKAGKKSGTFTAVCHSMRYHRGFQAVKRLLDEGRIGDLMTMDQIEQVGYRHFSHSFVRGNWGNQSRSSFMLLAKSCHDLDYISYLVGKPCEKVSSFGDLSYFRRSRAPKGSTDRCLDGCAVESTCPFSAPHLYLREGMGGWLPMPHSGSRVPSFKEMEQALRTGPFGRCVYRADNDVVDHQVVMLQFAGKVTATFTMTGFTETTARRLRLHGTEGELEFRESEAFPNGDKVIVKSFTKNQMEEIRIPEEGGSHGGADYRVMTAWLEAIQKKDASLILTNVEESLRTHTIVFAAETARLKGSVENMSQWYASRVS